MRYSSVDTLVGQVLPAVPVVAWPTAILVSSVDTLRRAQQSTAPSEAISFTVQFAMVTQNLTALRSPAIFQEKATIRSVSCIPSTDSLDSRG